MSTKEENNLIREIIVPLVDATCWMKTLAVFGFIGGVAQCFTTLGILVAWIPILMGVVLFQAASLAQEAKMSGDPETLKKCFAKLKVYFMLTVIIPVSSVIIILLAVVIFKR